MGLQAAWTARSGCTSSPYVTLRLAAIRLRVMTRTRCAAPIVLNPARDNPRFPPNAALHGAWCRYPIIQSAMGWVANHELVAAPSPARFPSSLVATLMPAEAEKGVGRVRELTGAFGVNFWMEQPGSEQIVDAIVRHHVSAAEATAAL